MTRTKFLSSHFKFLLLLIYTHDIATFLLISGLKPESMFSNWQASNKRAFFANWTWFRGVPNDAAAGCLHWIAMSSTQEVTACVCPTVNQEEFLSIMSGASWRCYPAALPPPRKVARWWTLHVMMSQAEHCHPCGRKSLCRFVLCTRTVVTCFIYWSEVNKWSLLVTAQATLESLYHSNLCSSSTGGAVA